MDWLTDFFSQIAQVQSHGFTRTGVFELVTIVLNTATILMLVPRLFKPHKLLSYGQTYRAALGIIVIGLAAQIPISLFRLLEIRLPDALAGMWSMKDIGLFLFIFSITFLGAQDKFKDWRDRNPKDD